jgi:colanic acid biosynthesis glycosyl transferase WcaI
MNASKRILFLTHYFPPEGNAPATRVYETARQWVKDGHQVTVITGAPNVPDGKVYPGHKNRLYRREQMDEIDILRVYTYIAPNKGMLRRIFNYLSFMMTAWIAGLFVRRPDVVIATSPQFFCGWAGVLLSKCRRLPFILEIRDLWPDSIVAVGAIANPKVIHGLEWLEKKMYALADHIVTVGQGYYRQLLLKGVNAEKMTVIPNGINAELYSPRPRSMDLRQRYGLNGEFICAYIGTIGMAAGLDTVLRAARNLKAEGNASIKFMLVGDGAERETLEEQAASEGLDNVIFTGRQDKSLMPQYLASVDACLVHLKKTDLFKSVLPSKIFEAAGMQKPIIMGIQGYASDIIRQSGGGICIEPENCEELLEAVSTLAANPDLARQYGEEGRKYFLRYFDRTTLSREYMKLIETMIGR